LKEKYAVWAAIASIAIAGLLLAGCGATAFAAIFLPGGHPPLSAYFAAFVVLIGLWSAPLGIALGAWSAGAIPRHRRAHFRLAVTGLACNAGLFLGAAYLYVLG
jgi:hypothetical protein